MLTNFVYRIQRKKRKKLLVVAGVSFVCSKGFEWMQRILSSLLKLLGSIHISYQEIN